MTDAYQCLDSLRAMLRVRRDQFRERAGHGLEERMYREMVGRIKECTELIEKVSEQIKSLNGDLDDDDTKKRSGGL